MNLRWLERDGKTVLQFERQWASDDKGQTKWTEWEDIPTVKEPRKARKDEMIINFAALCSAWSKLKPKQTQYDLWDLLAREVLDE